VKSGVIEQTWAGNMPPAVVDRFRDAFFPGIAKQASAPQAQVANAAGRA